MIYTVGKIVFYEEYINDGYPSKDVGGSAWKTLDDVRAYLLDWYSKDPAESIQFAVYAMAGDWDLDTIEDTDGNGRVIIRQCKLSRVLFREGGTLMRG